VTPAPAAEATPEAPAAGAAAAAARIALAPSSETLSVGDELTVSVRVENAQQLFGSPLRIRYNREVLTLSEITRGSFLAGPEATDLIFSRNIRNQVGQAAVNISRFPGTGGADGSGELLTLRFAAIAAGKATINVAPLGARNAEQQQVPITAAELELTVGQ
jgi:hypothetical protein